MNYYGLRKRIILFIAFFLIGSLRWIAYPTAAQESDAKEKLPVCLIVNPKQTTVEQKILLPGSFEPYEKVELFSKITGYVEEIPVDIGARVKKNQLLAQLSVPEIIPELNKAKADLSAAKAQLHKAVADSELAKLTYNRLSDLRKSEPRAITLQDVDIAAAKEKVAVSQVEVEEADLHVAEAQVNRLLTLLAYTEIRAPFDGIITKRFVDPGALIEAGNSKSKPVLEISNCHKLRLTINIPETIVTLVQTGNKTQFQLDALPGKLFDGTVTRLSEFLKPDIRSMRAEIDVENENEWFRAGMYAKVTLSFQDMTNVLTLPPTTIHPRQGKQGIFIVEQEMIRWIPINILLDTGTSLVIQGPLNEHTRVVLSGLSTLEEGQKVQVKSEGGTGL